MDLVAHCEYFFNTLSCENLTENPFKNLGRYPALTQEVSSGLTLFEKHRLLIFPQGSGKRTSGSSKLSSGGPGQGLDGKKYKWYPNH